MWALWDGGQWVERMYGHFRFLAIYLAAGLLGNFLSLVVHAGRAVSGGASGAIFGIYGALLSYLWLERERIQSGEFRWLFWAAVGFSVATIIFGLMIPGIDNAAHIGGLLAGLMLGVLLKPSRGPIATPITTRYAAGAGIVVFVSAMFATIPQQAYRWSAERLVQQEISEFLQEDAAISRAWESIMVQGGRKGASFEELADVIESIVAERYEHSFEELSALPLDTNLPSAMTAERLTRYAERRRDASRAMVEGLRAKDRAQVQKALEQARQAGRPE
jgi:rhomboid protease GluP